MKEMELKIGREKKMMGIVTLKCKWERRYQNEWARKKWSHHHLKQTDKREKNNNETENFCSTAKQKKNRAIKRAEQKSII